MFGLNPKVAGGILLVITVLSGLVYWQYGQIQGLNEKVGAEQQQNRQLTVDLNHQRQEAKQLRDYQQQQAENRRQSDEEKARLIEQLEAEAAAASRTLQEDPDAAVWLDACIPGAVSQRLRQLFPGAGEDGVQVCRPEPGRREGHADTGVARGQ